MLKTVFNWQSTSFVTILYGIVIFVFGIAAYFVTLWFSITFIKVIADSYQGIPTKNFKESITSSKPLLFVAFLTSLLSGLAILGGFILLIIPGIIFSIWFAFALYAVVLDSKKDTEAMKYSKKLVSGRWWAVFWRMFLPSLIFMIVSGAVQMPLDYIMNSSNTPTITLLALFVSSMVSIAFAPFLASAQTILYVELKKTSTAMPELSKQNNDMPEMPV